MNEMIEKLLRPHYRTLQGYVSAGMEAGKDPSKIFMNANENPYALPGLEGYNRYPEPQPVKLLESYARLYGISPDQIVATRGADEALMVLTKVFCEPSRDSVIITPPTFGMYSADALALPAGVVEAPLIEEEGTFRLDVDGIIKAVSEGVKIIFLCSPNNPTGTSFAIEDIEAICTAAAGKAIVALDETYAEFSTRGSLSAKLADHPNLIILRTLSKSYAMAGMRMGTMLCADTDFIALVQAKALDAYPLPVASIEAALKVMEPDMVKLAQANIKKLLAARDELRTAFTASDLVEHIYPSDANFLFIRMQRAGEFVKFCAQHNIILRDFSSKPGTENCIRISPGLPEENKKLIELLRKF